MLTLTRRFACVYFSMINIMFLFFRKFFIHFNSLLDILLFFMLWKSWECDTLSKISLTFRFKNDIIFFFVHFISCEFSSWWIAKSCLSIVVCVHSFKCSKACSTFRRRIENVLTQSISTSCLTCLTVRLTYTMMISCNFFCLAFAAL